MSSRSPKREPRERDAVVERPVPEYPYAESAPDEVVAAAARRIADIVMEFVQPPGTPGAAITGHDARGLPPDATQQKPRGLDVMTTRRIPTSVHGRWGRYNFVTGLQFPDPERAEEIAEQITRRMQLVSGVFGQYRVVSVEGVALPPPSGAGNYERLTPEDAAVRWAQLTSTDPAAVLASAQTSTGLTDVSERVPSGSVDAGASGQEQGPLAIGVPSTAGAETTAQRSTTGVTVDATQTPGGARTAPGSAVANPTSSAPTRPRGGSGRGGTV